MLIDLLLIVEGYAKSAPAGREGKGPSWSLYDDHHID